MPKIKRESNIDITNKAEELAEIFYRKALPEVKTKIVSSNDEVLEEKISDFFHEEYEECLEWGEVEQQKIIAYFFDKITRLAKEENISTDPGYNSTDLGNQKGGEKFSDESKSYFSRLLSFFYVNPDEVAGEPAAKKSKPNIDPS